MVADTPLVLADRGDDGVCTLTMNRPEKRNALSIELRFALADQLSALAEDAACRGVVLTGAGNAFCAGMDFSQFGGDQANKLNLLNSTKAFFSSLLYFPKPLVAAVNGLALGGGFVLALYCDRRLAGPEAYFGFFEVRRGIPAPFGIVRPLVDEDTARQWCDSGDRVEVAQAQAAGLVRPVESAAALLPAARAEIAAAPAARQINRQLADAFEAETQLFQAALFPDGVPGPRS